MKKFLKISWRVLKYAFLIFICVYFGALIYVLSFALKPNLPKRADAILVLGAKVNLDNTPSETLYNRTMEGVDLYQQGRAEYFITTGGQGLGYVPESKIAAIIAEQHGIPADKIITERESHNTFENIADVASQAKLAGVKSVIVVSDEFHIARGVLVAKHFGFAPVYWDYPNIGYYRPSQIIFNYAREAAAMIKYVPMVLISKH